MESMRENEFSPVGKILTVIIVAWFAITAAMNIMRGEVPHPFAFAVSLVGFLFFLIAKVSVISRTKRITFGPGALRPGMSLLYRVGYWLMALGLLATFAR